MTEDNKPPSLDIAYCCWRTHDECASKPGPMCTRTLLVNMGKTLTPAQAAALQRGADVAFIRDATSKSPHGDEVATVLEKLLGPLVADETARLVQRHDAYALSVDKLRAAKARIAELESALRDYGCEYLQRGPAAGGTAAPCPADSPATPESWCWVCKALDGWGHE